MLDSPLKKEFNCTDLTPMMKEIFMSQMYVKDSSLFQTTVFKPVICGFDSDHSANLTSALRHLKEIYCSLAIVGRFMGNGTESVANKLDLLSAPKLVLWWLATQLLVSTKAGGRGQ